MLRHLRTLRYVTGIITVLAAFACRAVAENPVVQTCFTADPAPMVHDGVVYLFTSHDEDDANGFHMLDWKCYSTRDMVNWTDHGAVASLATFKWADQGNGAWAPQCVERDGKFFLYVPISVKGWPANVIAVAVADNPLGPYTDALDKPLIDKGVGYFDPTAFVDDDGQAYLYWGNPTAWYVKLNKDMISYSGEITKAKGKPKNYQEGPWIYKHEGHYYLAYASSCCPEGIGYAMSDKPTGPWEFKGSIMDGHPLSSGNHPGIIDFHGKSYVFGFNYRLNWEQTDVHRERRCVVVAEMTYNSDGTIRKLPWWKDEGVAQVGTFNPFAQIDAATICYERGIKTLPRGGDKSGVYVRVVDNASYIKLKGVDFGDKGAAKFLASVASANEGTTITLRLDSEAGLPIGTIKVNPTGGLDHWETQSCGLKNATGVHDLYIKFFGPGTPLMNVDWWKFE